MAEVTTPQDSVDDLALDESVTFTSELIQIGRASCRERVL